MATQRTFSEFMSICEAVYGGVKKEPKDTRLTVTAADKKANTKAWQNYKAGDKRYKAASHLGEDSEIDEKFSMAADSSQPQSPKATKLPKSRERNVGRHDDWKDKETEKYGLMEIMVIKQFEKVYFALSESPFTLEVEKN